MKKSGEKVVGGENEGDETWGGVGGGDWKRPEKERGKQNKRMSKRKAEPWGLCVLTLHNDMLSSLSASVT